MFSSTEDLPDDWLSMILIREYRWENMGKQWLSKDSILRKNRMEKSEMGRKRGIHPYFLLY
jgi:hypothetical protein